MATECIPLVVIRYNPNKYINKDGNTARMNHATRLSLLKQTIDKYMNQEYEQKHMIEVVYLYYDEDSVQYNHVPIV